VWGCVAFFVAVAIVLSVYFVCPWCKPVAKSCCKEHADMGQPTMDAEAQKTLSLTASPADEEMSVEDEVENIYVLIQQINAREYTIMDTMIRTFHYAKPHKGPTHGCPECAEIHDRASNVDTVMISRDQWNKFKALEAAEKKESR
jgi:hypothetical protein